MSSLNILLIAQKESAIFDIVLQSKYLKKLYSNIETKNSVEIRFNKFKELVKKCKALKIDIVIVDDKMMILQGIADYLRANFINCIGINTYWTQLILSTKFSRDKMSKYGIEIPPLLSYPKEFPLVVRTDKVKVIANNVQEVLDIRTKLVNYSQEIADSIILEKYIHGEKYELTSLFDGQTLITFSNGQIDENLVQEYNSKLQTMFLKENSQFIGYINSNIVVSENTLVNVGFNIDCPQINNKDLLYIYSQAIYQKLSECQ